MHAAGAGRRPDRLLGSGWECACFDDERGRTATAWYPAGRTEWIERARRYWTGILPGLELVRRHAWGGATHRGRIDGVGYYFKRFSIRHPRYLHKPRRARNTLRNELRAGHFGFETPQPCCLIERRRIGLILDGAVIEGELPPAESLRQMLDPQRPAGALDWREKRQLLRAFGRALGRRHACGLFHGDLHPGNVQCRQADHGFQFAWLDNEEGSAGRRLPMRRRIHDLDHAARFKHSLSPAERLAFWSAYGTAAGLAGPDRDKVCRRVMHVHGAFRRKKGWMQP